MGDMGVPPVGGARRGSAGVPLVAPPDPFGTAMQAFLRELLHTLCAPPPPFTLGPRGPQVRNGRGEAEAFFVLRAVMMASSVGCMEAVWWC